MGQKENYTSLKAMGGNTGKEHKVLKILSLSQGAE